MLNEAKRQLQEISIEQIKSTLNKVEPEAYQKMIIEPDSIIRTNYYHSNLKYQIVERKLNIFKFPVYKQLQEVFSKFEGGVEKYGEKAYIKNNSIINALSDIPGVSNNELSLNDIPNAFDNNIDTDGEEISYEQRPYFLPAYTFSQICNTCNGNHYIQCPECDGHHQWQCQTCMGEGVVACSKCNGTGTKMCLSCMGKGYHTKRYDINSSETYDETCSKCGGTGQKYCSKCGGNGIEYCPSCQGTKVTTCQYCYDDAERYGKIDCPECLTAGVTGQIVFVVTEVKDKNDTITIYKGKDIGVGLSDLRSHIKSDIGFKNIYKIVNGIHEDIDEITEDLLKSYKDITETKNSYPMIVKQDFIYQVIPCLKLSYKHMLTNEIHELTIINFWDNPTVIFHSDAEKVKINAGSMLNSSKGIFGKLFKTKAFKEKEDKKIEIKLMIYFAKADGIIEEDEKIFLSEELSEVKNFTNSEKKELFDLMNNPQLPELTINDIKFTSKKKALKIIDKLEKLAKADGEYGKEEKDLINKIKQLIDNAF